VLAGVLAANLVVAWLNVGRHEEMAADIAGPPPVLRVEPSAAPAGTPVVHRNQTRSCLVWGPYTERTEAEEVAQRMRLDPGHTEFRESEVAVREEHLVLVRAAGPRQVAERIMKELHSRNVDSYIIRAGRDRGERDVAALAAGVFRDPGRADRHRNRLKEWGYDADVEAMRRSERVFHLLARVPLDAALEFAPARACDDIAPWRQLL